MFRLYRQPNPNEFFVCGADPAEGHDYCAGVWKSKDTAETVLVYHARIDSSQFAFELKKGSTLLYKATKLWPIIGVERNMGQATIAKLLDLNYPSLFHMQSFDDPTSSETTKIGWSTTSASRPKMLDELALSIRQGVNRTDDQDTLKEMLSFIRHAKTGKPEAESGTHDDLVMAEAIAWQLYQLVPSPGVEMNLPDDTKLFSEGFYGI